MSEPPASPQARRVGTPSWFDLRLVLGVALVLVAVLVGALVVGNAKHTTARVTVTRDLAASSVLSASDLTISQVQLPGGDTGIYVGDVHDAVGEQLQRPVSRGELLPRAALTKVAQRTTVTVPLSSGAAPDLHVGQRIEIWASTSTCSSVVLLPDVTVQDVRSDEDSALTGSGAGQDVVVTVTPAFAQRVVAALAIDQVQLRAGVLVGNGSPSATDASQLPALGSCSTDAGR